MQRAQVCPHQENRYMKKKYRKIAITTDGLWISRLSRHFVFSYRIGWVPYFAKIQGTSNVITQGRFLITLLCVILPHTLFFKNYPISCLLAFFPNKIFSKYFIQARKKSIITIFFLNDNCPLRLNVTNKISKTKTIDSKLVFFTRK